MGCCVVCKYVMSNIPRFTEVVNSFLKLLPVVSDFIVTAKFIAQKEQIAEDDVCICMLAFEFWNKDGKLVLQCDCTNDSELA